MQLTADEVIKSASDVGYWPEAYVAHSQPRCLLLAPLADVSDQASCWHTSATMFLVPDTTARSSQLIGVVFSAAAMLAFNQKTEIAASASAKASSRWQSAAYTSRRWAR
jgi:hypothetical protein